MRYNILDMNNRETIETLPQIFNDPVEYLNYFRDSDTYKNTYIKFYEGKKLSSDVSEADKRDVFEGDETCRKLLIEFARTQDKVLSYAPEYYSEDFRENIKDYFSLIQDYDKGRISGHDGISAYDRLRGSYHDAAAQVLTASTGVPHRLARGLIQVMTVQKGLDTFDSAGQDERRRLLSTLR